MSEFAAGQCMFPFHASAVIGHGTNHTHSLLQSNNNGAKQWKPTSFFEFDFFPYRECTEHYFSESTVSERVSHVVLIVTETAHVGAVWQTELQQQIKLANFRASSFS